MFVENGIEKYYGYEIAEMLTNEKLKEGTKLIDNNKVYYEVSHGEIYNVKNRSIIYPTKLYNKSFNFVIEEKLDVKSLQIGDKIQVKYNFNDSWNNKYYLYHRYNSKNEIEVYASNIKFDKDVDIFAVDNFTGFSISSLYTTPYKEYRLYIPHLDR